MNDIKVSVVMAAYNHSKYIEKALRSAVEQNVKFAYEVIVGDDASPDNTPEIIKKVYNDYPNIIKPVLRTKNLGAFRNTADLSRQCKGEYIAFLEGDDFWTDTNKLQKQVDFLDSHSDFAACCHKNCIVDDENNIISSLDDTFCNHEEYTWNDFSDFVLPGQTATLLVRRELIVDFFSNKKTQSAIKKIRYTPGDRLLALGLLCNGRVYCSDEVMSAYRFVIKKGGTNWRSSYGNYNRRTSMYFIKMSHEIERFSEEIGHQIFIETEDKKAFKLALWKVLNCEIRYYFNVIYLLLRSRHRRDFIMQLRNQEKEAFDLACWRVLNGKKKFYFNLVLLFLVGKTRKDFWLKYKETKKTLRKNNRFKRKQKIVKLKKNLSSIKWKILNSVKKR